MTGTSCPVPDWTRVRNYWLGGKDAHPVGRRPSAPALHQTSAGPASPPGTQGRYVALRHRLDVYADQIAARIEQ